MKTKLLLLLFPVLAFTGCSKEDDINNPENWCGTTLGFGNAPTADFTFINSAGSNAITVSFSDASQNALTWTWDFGDASTSTSQNPTHTYAAEGRYTVTLTAYNYYGSSAVTKNVNLWNVK